MERLEQLVRDTLHDRAAEAPDVEGLRGSSSRSRPRRSASWLAVAAAAAVVVVLSVALVAVDHRPARHRPLASTQVPPVPPGQKIVSYHGIELAVPSSLSISTFACGPPQVSSVFLANGLAHSCPAMSGKETTPRGLTTLSLGPLLPNTAPQGSLTKQRIASAPTTVGTTAARIGYSSSRSGVTGLLVIPSVEVDVVVTTPSRRQTDAILATTRVVTVDRVGCPAHITSLTPTGNSAAAELVPAHPVSAVLCEYQLGNYYDSYNRWLLQSRQLAPSAIAHVAAAINALPAHSAGGSPAKGLHDLLTFTYADGSTRTIDASTYTYGDARLITDGLHTVVDVDGALLQLLASG